MSVDLNDLIEDLKIEVSPPGTDLYPNATDETWLNHLRTAFWDARLYGMLEGFEENAAFFHGSDEEFGEGIITPSDPAADYDLNDEDEHAFNPTKDLSRDMQQLIILWAGWRITLTKMQDIKTLRKAKAGPVEYETQQSAGVLKATLDALKEKIDFVRDRMSNISRPGATVFDAVIERTYSQYQGDTWWLR